MTAASPGLLAEIENSAQAYLKTRVESTVVVGLTVEGQRHVRSFRSPDARLAALPTADSVYEIGSISKTLTLTLFAVLEAEGLLSLDDAIGKHLTHLELKPEIAAITLRDLATHSAGLPSVGPLHLQLILEEAAGATAPPFGAYTHYLRYRKEHLYADLESVTLDYPTGKGWAYSIIGMGTLGHILELVTSTPYEELLKDKVCRPLGMPDTGYTLATEQLLRLVRAYDLEGQPRQSWYHDVLLPQGGLRSTTADMLSFAEANIRASSAGDDSPLSVALRRTRQIHHQVPASTISGPVPAPWTDEVVQGLAWRGFGQGAGLAWWHPGTTLFYHCGIGVDEEQQVGLTMLTSDAHTLLQMDQLNELFLSWLRYGA